MNQVKGQWTHDYLGLWHLHTVTFMCIVLHACLPGMDFPLFLIQMNRQHGLESLKALTT